MPATTRMSLRYPVLTDNADVPEDIGNLAADVDARAAMFAQGTLAARPVVGKQGRFYMATDQSPQALFYDNGSQWISVGQIGADTITDAMLADDVAVIPIGGAIDWPWGDANIPGWARLPHGQAISRATYAALHTLASAAGYPHGSGDGSTTFNVPDYRGRISAGKDDMGGAAANRITVGVSGINGALVGATGGVQGVTLTTGQMPAHNHGGGNHDHGGGNLTHTAENGQEIGTRYSVGSAMNSASVDYQNDVHLGSSPLTYSGNIIAAQSVISSEGGGGAHPNVQPTIIVNKIMRAV